MKEKQKYFSDEKLVFSGKYTNLLSTILPGGETSVMLSNDEIQKLENATNIIVEAGRTSTHFSTPDLKLASDALSKCKANVWSKLGIDLVAVSNIATLPKPTVNPTAFVTVADYPSEALRKKEYGIVHMLWRIDPAGKPKDCRIAKSSGSESLDAISCRVVMDRARYKPALDVSGNPISAWDARSIVWTLPPTR